MTERVNRPTRSVLVVLCTVAVGAVTVLPATTGHAEPSRLDKVQSRVQELHHQAEQAAERYNDARVLRTRVQRHLGSLRERVQQRQAELESKQATVGALAADTYRNGGFGSEMQLIFANSPRDFLDQATALQQVSRQQAQALRGVIEARQQLAADQRLLVAQQAELDKLRKKLAGEKAEVEQRLDKAQSLLGTLEAKQRARLAAQRAAAARQAAAEASSYSGSASGRAGVAVDYAYDQMGEPYAWGADGPDSWDCSGLTMMAWRAAGVSLPHSSSMQYEQGRKVAYSDLQPGDLVFFYEPVSHVGIYIGDGNMIHAPNESEPVSIDPISYMPFTGATRP